tara:strand:+ start:294 stop:827 length:534 start_codon:yes stop_codon:yes gene_type:complete
VIQARQAVLAGSLAAAVSLVAYFEGRELVGYLDPVGIPTICYGHTKTAVVGQALGPQECERLLREDLGEALAVVDQQLPNAPAMTRAALGSFVYNVGAGAFNGSTLLRKAKAGDWVGACNELPRWVYAKGRQLPGLVNRRAAERAVCLEGLSNGASSDQRSDRATDRPGRALVAVRP